jgi:hypothetical protein
MTRLLRRMLSTLGRERDVPAERAIPGARAGGAGCLPGPHRRRG